MLKYPYDNALMTPKFFMNGAKGGDFTGFDSALLRPNIL